MRSKSSSVWNLISLPCSPIKALTGDFAVDLLDQIIDAAGCQAGSLDAVEGRRDAALLQMPQDRLAHIEQIVTFFFEQGTHEGGVVDRVGIFVADHQPQPFAVLKAVVQLFHVVLQIFQGDAFFVEIDPLGAGRQPAHQRQVAAVAAHHFDHEAAPLGDRRLFDLVDRFDDVVQGSVCADAQLGAGQVVVDRGRQADDRDIEGRVVLALR